MSIGNYIRYKHPRWYPAYLEVRALPGRVRLRKTCILKTWAGDDPCSSSRRAAIYVNFDRHGIVHDYVLHSLAQLAAANFRIHFICNSPRLDSTGLARLKPLCGRICQRRNAGHDFGGYRDGFISLPDRSQLDLLLIMNDSIYGPFFPIEDLLARADPGVAEVWGACDSWDIQYHLQTYFILFHKAALTNPAVLKFWRTLPYVNHRDWIIANGEVGLTQKLLAAGVKCRPLFPYEDVSKRFEAGAAASQAKLGRSRNGRVFFENVGVALEGGGPLNPTHCFWETLIRDFSFPFIKRDLLQSNPMAVPGVSRWRTLLSEYGYDPELITAHLRLLAKNRTI